MLLSDAEKVMLGGKRVTSVLHGDRRLLGFTNLAPNPSFETLSGATTEIRRNYSFDPTLVNSTYSEAFSPAGAVVTRGIPADSALLAFGVPYRYPAS